MLRNTSDSVVKRNKTKPTPKKDFTPQARENWEQYQALRETNKTLNHLNKKYHRPVILRQVALKNSLISNSEFVNDYNRILTAYNNQEDIGPDEMRILNIFDYKPLSLTIDNSNSDADDFQKFQ